MKVTKDDFDPKTFEQPQPFTNEEAKALGWRVRNTHFYANQLGINPNTIWHLEPELNKRVYGSEDSKAAFEKNVRRYRRASFIDTTIKSWRQGTMTMNASIIDGLASQGWIPEEKALSIRKKYERMMVEDPIVADSWLMKQWSKKREKNY